LKVTGDLVGNAGEAKKSIDALQETVIASMGRSDKLQVTSEAISDQATGIKEATDAANGKLDIAIGKADAILATAETSIEISKNIEGTSNGILEAVASKLGAAKEDMATRFNEAEGTMGGKIEAMSAEITLAKKEMNLYLNDAEKSITEKVEAAVGSATQDLSSDLASKIDATVEGLSTNLRAEMEKFQTDTELKLDSLGFSDITAKMNSSSESLREELRTEVENLRTDTFKRVDALGTFIVESNDELKADVKGEVETLRSVTFARMEALETTLNKATNDRLDGLEKNLNQNLQAILKALGEGGVTTSASGTVSGQAQQSSDGIEAQPTHRPENRDW